MNTVDVWDDGNRMQTRQDDMKKNLQRKKKGKVGVSNEVIDGMKKMEKKKGSTKARINGGSIPKERMSNKSVEIIEVRRASQEYE